MHFVTSTRLRFNYYPHARGGARVPSGFKRLCYANRPPNWSMFSWKRGETNGHLNAKHFRQTRQANSLSVRFQNSATIKIHCGMLYTRLRIMEPPFGLEQLSSDHAQSIAPMGSYPVRVSAIRNNSVSTTSSIPFRFWVGARIWLTNLSLRTAGGPYRSGKRSRVGFTCFQPPEFVGASQIEGHGTAISITSLHLPKKQYGPIRKSLFQSISSSIGVLLL